MSQLSTALTVTVCLGLLFAPPPPRQGSGEPPARATTKPDAGAKPKRAPVKAGKPPVVAKKVKAVNKGKPARLERPKPARAATKIKPARAHYEKREASAPKQVKTDLDKLRKDIGAKAR